MANSAKASSTAASCAFSVFGSLGGIIIFNYYDFKGNGAAISSALMLGIIELLRY